MAILMCPPEFFGIEYEINPWMHLDVRVERRTARAQWQALHDLYRQVGETVELVDPVAGLPDMVFTANAGLVWRDVAVLSSFRHPERQGEEPYWHDALSAHGFSIHRLPDGIAFEGAGDGLFVGDRLFCGSGFRSDVEAHGLVAEILNVEVVSIQLIDPRFYHLDTCFCPLDDRTVLVNPTAFTPESLERIRKAVPRVVEAPPEVAAGFACNAMPLDRRVVASSTIADMTDSLAALGYSVVALPMTEFMKSGGGVRCLSLPLRVGV